MVQLQRYQQGYVYKRGKRKVWYGRYRDDSFTPEGKVTRRTRNVRLGTLTELPSRVAAVGRLQQHIALQKPKTSMTFAELYTRWQLAAMPTIKRTTANYYQQNVRSYILPIFGQQEIADITREDVQRFLAGQAGKYTKNSLRGMRVSLGRVLTWAVECNWLEKNPCSRLKLPEAGREKANHKLLTTEQMIAIAGKVKEPYSTLVLFLAVTGLRIGEAIGVKWSDFEGDVLEVSRTVYGGRAQSPKTKRSKRRLPIPAVLIERMRALGDAGSGYIFRARAGTPVNPGNALKRYIHPVAKELGIAIGGWHDFRRTVATKLLRSGESAKLVSGILGNSVEILLNSYDLTEVENFRRPLAEVAEQLLPVVTKPNFADSISD